MGCSTNTGSRPRDAAKCLRSRGGEIIELAVCLETLPFVDIVERWYDAPLDVRILLPHPDLEADRREARFARSRSSRGAIMNIRFEPAHPESLDVAPDLRQGGIAKYVDEERGTARPQDALTDQSLSE